MANCCNNYWEKWQFYCATAVQKYFFDLSVYSIALFYYLIYYTGNRQASIDVTLRLEGLKEPKKYALELTDLPAHVKPPPKSFYEVSSYSMQYSAFRGWSKYTFVRANLSQVYPELGKHTIDKVDNKIPAQVVPSTKNAISFENIKKRLLL